MASSPINPLAPPLSDPPRDDAIRAAQRVEEFFRDDVIRNAINRVEQKYIDELIAAEHSEGRAKAQGKVHAIRAFTKELAAMIENGVQEALMQEAEARRKEFLKQDGQFVS